MDTLSWAYTNVMKFRSRCQSCINYSKFPTTPDCGRILMEFARSCSQSNCEIRQDFTRSGSIKKLSHFWWKFWWVSFASCHLFSAIYIWYSPCILVKKFLPPSFFVMFSWFVSIGSYFAGLEMTRRYFKSVRAPSYQDYPWIFLGAKINKINPTQTKWNPNRLTP